MSKWIKISDKLPNSQDGITQVWLRKSSWIEEGHICPFVLGSHAMMYKIGENDKDGIEGICDIHKPDGVWEISDFTHWMPFPKMPEGWR